MLERKTGNLVRGLIGDGVVKTVHDLSDGGLIVAAAEMALASGVGIALMAVPANLGQLFGEDQAATCSPCPPIKPTRFMRAPKPPEFPRSLSVRPEAANWPS